MAPQPNLSILSRPDDLKATLKLFCSMEERETKKNYETGTILIPVETENTKKSQSQS